MDYDKFVNTTQYIMRKVRSLWSYVRSKRDVKGYPRVMTYGDSSADCLVDIANLFASYFQSVYIQHDNVPVQMPMLSDISLSW